MCVLLFVLMCVLISVCMKFGTTNQKHNNQQTDNNTCRRRRRRHRLCRRRHRCHHRHHHRHLKTIQGQEKPKGKRNQRARETKGQEKPKTRAVKHKNKQTTGQSISTHHSVFKCCENSMHLPGSISQPNWIGLVWINDFSTKLAWISLDR